MTLQQKIEATVPKKILALDGGGIRGIITIEILKEIETLLRMALNRNETFVLADYFDYLSGTSTGAIIAACLSLGWPVNRIRGFYIHSGARMFDKASFLKKSNILMKMKNSSNYCSRNLVKIPL